MTCARCGAPAAHHEIALPAHASRLIGGCPGLASLHSPRRHQRARLALRQWWHHQQRPTARSVDYAVTRSRPLLSPVAAGFMAFVALSLAATVTAREAAALGWHGTEGAGWFALCGVGIVAALLLEFPALIRWLR